MRKVIALIAVLIVLLAGGYLFWQGFEGEHESPSVSEDLGPLGALGSACGGAARLPCNPGLVCDPNDHQHGGDYGTCVTDEREPAELMNEGESCDQLTRACGPGLHCEIPDGADEGTCVTISTKPFLMAVIPEGMELVNGAYRAEPGTNVTVRVRAINVSGGALYLKPLTASYAGVRPEDKISGLERQGEGNEYIGSFTVTENLGASLIAVMQGEDGQEVEVSVNVAATFE